MQEILQHIFTQVRGTWRYRWYALGFAWLIALAGWAVVLRVPDRYEASARVYVDTETILRPLLRGLTVQTDVNQRLQLMSRTLLSRPNLEKLARMTDLDINAKTAEELEALLTELGKRIQLNSAPRGNLYTISYQHREPQVAKRVVQAALTTFVESTLGDTRQESDSAKKFLDQQIKEYEERLVEAENRLMEFKRKYMGTLPGQGGSFFERLQAAQAQLEVGRLELREAEQKRNALQRQFAEGEDAESVLSAATSVAASPLAARVQALQAKLDAMLLKYTEEHPDVKELRRTIVILEKQQQEEARAMAAAPAGLSAANPLHEQRRLLLGQADANLAAMRIRVQEYQERVQKLQQLIDALPQVETDFQRLNRDYAVNKQSYEALIARRESAKLSGEAEQVGDDIKFKVIDPPRVPLVPSGPNRLLFSSFVLLAALGGGAGLAFLMFQMRPGVYDRRTLEQLCGLPVLGTVSLVWTPALIRRQRLERTGFFSATMLLPLVFGFVLWLHLQYIRGPGQLVQALRAWL